MSFRTFTFFTFALITCFAESRGLISQSAPSTPRVELSAAPRLRFTGDVDSNSPAVWQRVGGVNQLLVLTSVAGQPSLATGPQLDRLSVPLPIVVDPWPGEGVWMEATVADDDGTLYGYYHNENSAHGLPWKRKSDPTHRRCTIGRSRADVDSRSVSSSKRRPDPSTARPTTCTSLAASETSACSSIRTRAICTSSTPSTRDDRKASAWRGWRGPIVTTPAAR